MATCCCLYCQAENMDLTRDHVIPRSKQGSNKYYNAALICEDCNTKKGDVYLEKFLYNNPPKCPRKIKTYIKRFLIEYVIISRPIAILSRTVNKKKPQFIFKQVAERDSQIIRQILKFLARRNSVDISIKEFKRIDKIVKKFNVILMKKLTRKLTGECEELLTNELREIKV